MHGKNEHFHNFPVFSFQLLYLPKLIIGQKKKKKNCKISKNQNFRVTLHNFFVNS